MRISDLSVRRPVFATVLSLALVIIVLPLFLDSPEPRDSDAALNVVSLNVQATNRARDRIVDWFDGSGADLVVLLETS